MLKIVSNMIPESEKVIYELVKFENVLINYDVTQNFGVEFSLDKSVKGSSKDWIGIFHAGWNCYESFLVYEYALGIPCDDTGRRRKVKFISKYFQHAKPGVPYQFVYVNKYLEIMGVSQYFQFIANNHNQYPISEDTIYEVFSPKQESSPVKDSDFNTNNNGIKDNDIIKNRKFKKTCITHPNPELYSNCKLYTISKWKDSYTSCYLCRDIFTMKESHDELVEKVKQYQDHNSALQNRVDRLEKLLKWVESEGKSDFKSCMFHITEEVGGALTSSDYGQEVNSTVFSHGCFDWDFSSKELYLKAVIGQQEFTIRDLKKVICELGYIDQPKLCCKPLHDTVKKVRAEERVVAEVYDINNNTSEEEF